MFYLCSCWYYFFCFFKQKTAYEMRISDWSSDVCSSDLKSRPKENPFEVREKSTRMLKSQTASRSAASGPRQYARPGFLVIASAGLPRACGPRNDGKLCVARRQCLRVNSRIASRSEERRVGKGVGSTC